MASVRPAPETAVPEPTKRLFATLPTVAPGADTKYGEPP